MREPKIFDIFLLVLLGVIWGSSFFNIKIASYTYEPFTLALVRVIVASIPLVGLCLYKNIRIQAFSKNWKDYALIGACNITIPFALIAVAGVVMYGRRMEALDRFAEKSSMMSNLDDDSDTQF